MSRDIRFGLVLSRAEKRALDELAQHEGGLSQAAVLRRLIRMAARRHGLWPARHLRSDQQDQEVISER